MPSGLLALAPAVPLQSVALEPCLHVTGASVPQVVAFPSAEIVPPTLRVVAGAKFEIPTVFPVNTVTFDPPEALAKTAKFEPSVVELVPIVRPLRTPMVPTVAKGTANVSVVNEALPLTVRELVGLVVPIPTQAFELITTTLEPPPTFEKMATFEPRTVEL